MWLLFSLPLSSLNQLCRHNRRRTAILGGGKNGETHTHQFHPGIRVILQFAPSKQKPDTLMVHNTVHPNENVL